MKRCPRCDEDLPLSAFGIDRARVGGLNTYCKHCVRQRNIDARLSRRQYDEVHRKACQPSFPVWRLNLPPREAVLLAIQRGASDQETIKSFTRLHVDDLTDAIADLWAENKLDRSALKQRIYRMVA